MSRITERDWANLPPELIKMIGDNLCVLGDIACFASVCNPWRSVAKTIRIPPQLPWLMLPTAKEKGHFEFFSLSNKRIYRPRIPQDLKPCVFLGLNRGCWVLAVGNPDSCLFNPFTQSKISLPPLTAIADVHRFDSLISRAVLSSDPSSSSDWVLMVFLTSARKFAICRDGDGAWTAVPASCHRYKSMAYCNGKFYMVTSKGSLVVCDATTFPPETTAISLLWCRSAHWFYLVESAGNLLLVTRVYNYGNDGNDELFYVYKLDMERPVPNWTRIDGIGDQVLFLSNNHSISLPASDCAGCRTNCIYYGDPFYKHEELNVDVVDRNIGVYSMEEDDVQMIPCKMLRNSRKWGYATQWGLASWVRLAP